jgi:hypothetical protein
VNNIKIYFLIARDDDVVETIAFLTHFLMRRSRLVSMNGFLSSYPGSKKKGIRITEKTKRRGASGRGFFKISSIALFK